MTTTNQGDEMEASKVTVGSRLTLPALPGYSGELVRFLPHDRLEIRWTDPGGIVHTDQHWGLCNIGGALEVASPAPVDWRRWLPPYPLPDTGRPERQVGQVWASRWDSVEYPDPSRRRVLRLRDVSGLGEVLAGHPGIGGAPFSLSKSILVQDVNEPHPRDPATLWRDHCNHGGCRLPLAEGNVELCAEHVESVMGRPAQQGAKAAPVTPQCQPSCRPVLRCSYCTTEVAGPTPPTPVKPKCPACDEERDLGATGKCWDCYEVGEAYVALVQQDADAKRAEIKRALMRPATLEPLWQRNPNVGVWRLR